MTSQYPGGFRLLTSRPTFEWETDKRQIWHVLKRCSEKATGLKIDKDFPQSYWRALQLFVQ